MRSTLITREAGGSEMSPVTDLRSSFHRGLDDLGHRIGALLSLVAVDVAASATILLTSDRLGAAALLAREREIDALQGELEATVIRQFALQQPMARDLRQLVCAVTLVPQLERSHDLAEHIAQRALTRLADQLSPGTRD